MQFFYPTLPYQPRVIDTFWEPEYTWAGAHGLAVGLVDVDAGRVYAAQPGQPVLYRGWMLTAPEYDTMARLLPLAVSPAAYFASHEATGWYEAVATHTFPSRFLTEPIPLDFEKGRRYFVKGLVKSFGATSVVATQAQLDNFWQQHELAAGTPLFVRDFAELRPHSERRFFVVRGQAYGANGTTLPAALQPVLATLASPLFCSLDVAETLAGQLVLVEIGDGQVSDLKEWLLPDFGGQVLQALAENT